MDTTPISGLDELDKHLDDLVQDPALALNHKFFDDVELQLTETNIPPLIPRFLPRLTLILKNYTQDPAIIASLTTKLLGPVPFIQILQLASPDELIQALDSPAPAANLLAITVLHKAAASPNEIAMLCMFPHLVRAFIHRWLAAPQVEVGHKATKVLGDLLDIDCELPPPPPPSQPGAPPPSELVLRKAPGQGALWSLLFRNPDMYIFLLDLCSGRHPDTANNPHQLSLAQGRVLRILPRLAALNLPIVSHSSIPTPAAIHLTNGNGNSSSEDTPATTSNITISSTPQPGQGFLQFAALRMVERSDTLMHLNLVDFFEALVSLLRVTEYSAQKVETLRAVLGEATAGDPVLREALLTLPDRTVEEEAEGLRRWLGELLPGEAVLAIR